MSGYAVPVIDVAPLRAGDPAGKADVARQIDHAAPEPDFSASPVTASISG